MQKIDARSYPCQDSPCRTCPFEGREPTGLTEARLTEIYRNVATFQGSHLCHSASNEKLCRGGRNIQIKIAFALGYIEAPTDEEFQKALEEYGSGERPEESQ